MRHRWFIAGLLVALMGCGSGENGGDNLAKASPASGEARAPEGDRAPYRLETNFFGLIAYAEENNELWAYLVNANYKPAAPEAGLLPPGVLDEPAFALEASERAVQLQGLFPPHLARITTENATVTGGPIPDPLPLGAEIRFNMASPSGADIDISAVSAGADIVASRALTGTLETEVEALDDLDRSLNPGTPLPDSRIAARVLISKGTVRANPVPQPTGPPRSFRFKTAADPGGCPGAAAGVKALAEQVNVVDEHVSGPVTLDIGGGAAPITLTRTDPSKPMIINVLNQVPHEGGAMDAAFDRHLEAYRWFYNLVAEPRPARDRQYFPCEVDHGDFGGDKCPGRRVRIRRP